MSAACSTPTPRRASPSSTTTSTSSPPTATWKRACRPRPARSRACRNSGNLIVIWDDNKISIEHETDIAFGEDVLKRYEAYGWHTQRVDWVTPEGYKEDPDALLDAIENAKAETGKPSIIALSTIIGWPSPTKQNTGGVHGSALGADEVAGLKKVLGFDPEQTFVVEPEVLSSTCTRRATAGRPPTPSGTPSSSSGRPSSPSARRSSTACSPRKLPDNWADALPTFEVGT